MTKLAKFTALMSVALLLIVFKINVLPTTFKEFMGIESADVRSKNTPRSDRLFKAYDQAAYRLAQKIERSEPISPDEVNALGKEALNARYGQEITFLFHAMSARNLQVIDVLLGAGASPYLIDKPSTISTRDFTYYLTLPGNHNDPTSLPFINAMLKLYLQHGGDPNHRRANGRKNPLLVDLAMMGNFEGFELLLAAGADPWLTGERANGMSQLAKHPDMGHRVEELIDEGHFDKVSLKDLERFMLWNSARSRAEGVIGEQRRRIALRVLKRNPEYPADRHTELLFKGPIPWDEVRKAP
jgi:hypothetical protein